MSAHDVDTIRTAYEQFAEHDAAALLAELDPRVEWVECGGSDSAVRHVHRAGQPASKPPPENPITQSEEERMQWTIQLQLVGSRWA